MPKKSMTRMRLSARKELEEILNEFPVGDLYEIASYGNGKIHDTYLVKTAPGGTRNPTAYILQRLHAVFQQTVLEDIDAVTQHLSKKGVRTPKLIRTNKGTLGLMRADQCWRMMIYLPGISYEKNASVHQIEDAAMLLGRFHNALTDLDYQFQHIIPDFHNTPRIIERMTEVTDRFHADPKHAILAPLATRIHNAWIKLKPTIPPLPPRIIHGDPKLNNVRFDEHGRKAIALLDFDTLGKNAIIVDLGDAIRSWCKRGKGQNVYLDLELFETFIHGYMRTAAFLTPEEKHAIPAGINQILLELAARYLIDAFEEIYFKLEPKYTSLFQQNQTKISGQLALYDDLQKKQRVIKTILQK
ncbi:MAG: hypothetical protein G01um101466_37 [Parcubacteria group bacterium Gr01-1014_66]|nr:MAG: hypothetical protein G01um101466_37 [Parcubacteria group bacterium Gr01-1014_66]